MARQHAERLTEVFFPGLPFGFERPQLADRVDDDETAAAHQVAVDVVDGDSLEHQLVGRLQFAVDALGEIETVHALQLDKGMLQRPPDVPGVARGSAGTEIAGIEHRHRAAGAGEFDRRVEAGDAGADNRDIDLARRFANDQPAVVAPPATSRASAGSRAR